ncbi:hypothetical protein AHF37_03347 [Paragonimus kellicotti]|nr:hypothetical protein AHF37_03347 [Paragonimus kellicotti]
MHRTIVRHGLHPGCFRQIDAMSRKGTAKLEELLQIEREIQTLWEKEKAFEADAIRGSDIKDKFFATFPYPYMNGRLHLGHTFSLLKCEFAIGFSRLQGRHTLWPFGFHCTGTPIRASADKLVRECDQYGCPPVFPSVQLGSVHEASGKNELGADPSKSKKSKAAAKSGDSKFQWQIMESLGLNQDEILGFKDPSYWLKFFPQEAVSDLKRLGVKVSLFRQSLPRHTCT